MQTYDAVVTAFGHEPNQHLRETFGRIPDKYLAFPDSIGALNTLRSNGFVRGVLSKGADIVPAKALGLSCVWVNRPGHVFGHRGRGAETATPDGEINSLADLISLLT